MESISLNDKNLNGGRVSIFVDTREPFIISDHLSSLGAEAIPKQLLVGDYICSERVGIEKKTIGDFLQSIINQRMFKQLKNLTESFENPLLIIEGNPEILFLERDIHPNAIRGVLSSIAIDYKVPIIWTSNPKETAGMIYWIAKREQIRDKKVLQIRYKIKPDSISSHQEFLVAGLPSVSTVLTKRLLEKFKTVRKVFNAKPEQLMKVDGLGKEKASKIWDLINKKYEPEDLTD